MAEPSDSLVETPLEPRPIVARASNEYRIKRFLLVLLLLGYGLWSCYDGFVKMPRANADAVARQLKKLPYPGYDVPFNQVFGVALPPLALLLLGWSAYTCRGEYRLDGDTLALPGHPPFPLSAVTAVDRAKWDRKGIAYVDYQASTGPKGRAKLDDFVYQREPTDRIFDRVLAAVEVPAPLPDVPADLPVGGPATGSVEPPRRL